MTELAVGQVWADNDPRAEGRTLEILELLSNGAVCEIVADRKDLPPTSKSAIGRRTIIRADRFRPTKTGYRLVSEP